MKRKEIKNWADVLPPEQYKILREKGTEKPFSGSLLYNKEKGAYKCAACGEVLFTSGAKFESGTGWPSFDKPAKKGAVKEKTDLTQGMIRKEVICPNCGSHLGHVFNDGPTETKKRYCINSCSLTFEKDKNRAKLKKATFAAGCFWHVEDAFMKIKGVEKTLSGFTGGTKPNPTYEEVCTGKTGHAEAVEIEFDPKIVPYEKLLEVFWRIHDPTTKNRQGMDIGTQYRSAIFYHSQKQKEEAQNSMQELEKERQLYGKIVTEIVKAGPFYAAEEYHQKYFQKNNVKACALM